ncbi:MAG TPA: response regulator [Terriglobales bacterium]|nr:response regulator [Terriglobales bacterium]
MDDEPEVREVAVDMLEMKGYKTLATSDPMVAVQIARTEAGPIQLLLTDVVMPIMNGRQLSEQIRVIRPGIKVLFMSAYSTQTVDDYGVRIAPGAPFVMKPFTMETLATQVRAILDYRSPFSKRLPT